MGAVLRRVYNSVRHLWRNLFDVRPGEYRRTVFMSFYLLFVLFAYYVLKSASEAMFLNKFDIDKLPDLYILMAVFGGALAYVYSKMAARTSLNTAVTWTLFISIACLVAMWFPLRYRQPTMVYVFAVWVRLFSVVTVTQGWVVATNLFNPREAKRVYGLLGMGMVVGAAFGGEFTTDLVHFIGTDNLLFASAPLVLLAYVSYLIAVSGHTEIRAARGDTEPVDFSFRDVAGDIGRNRHLQVLILIMSMQFIVDTFIDYQFKYMAKQAFHGDALTAFLGRFYGRYLNITELVLQFFFTTAVVRRLGVGGTLQVMPVSLAAASMFTLVSPSVLSASLARLVEASTRYTLSRTGTELFYMPLPIELRNRIKAFIDIFVDRAARGIAGGVLILFADWKFGVRGVTLVTICVTVPWVLLTIRAHHEYVRTIRRRIEARRLDIESARITVEDAETERLLESTALGPNPRQAAYALSLLNVAPKYEVKPLVEKLADSPFDDVRAEVYRLARLCRMAALTDRAQAEIHGGSASDATRQAVVYLLTLRPERLKLSLELLDQPNPAVQEGVVEALTAQPEAASEIVTHEWISRNARDPDWRRRALAAAILAARGDKGIEALHALLSDPDPRVAEAACRSAAALKNRAYLLGIVRLLANPRVRGTAIESLAQFGPSISGTLGDLLEDDSLDPAIRAAIPRVLRRIPHQRSADVLLAALKLPEPAVRDAALKALARLRATTPGLNCEDAAVNQTVLDEARRYYELVIALKSLEEFRDRPRSALALLAKTVEERQYESVQRLFRLLSLRYPSNEMYWTWLALSRPGKEQHATAVEYLDNVLGQDLKRVILPMLDAPERLPERARALFGIEPATVESTIRALVASDDAWVSACAISAAAELHLRDLANDIAAAARNGRPHVAEVAHAALATFGV